MYPGCKNENYCYIILSYKEDKECDEPNVTNCEICKEWYCNHCHSDLLDDGYRDACKKCQEKLNNNLNQYVISEISEIVICYLIGEDYFKTLKNAFY